MREAIKIYNSTASLPENGPSFTSTVSGPTNKYNRQDNEQQLQQDNSAPSDIHSVSNSSNSFISLNSQESYNINTQTYMNTITSLINESSTQNPKPYSHALSTPQCAEQEPNYYSLTQLQQTYPRTLNNTLFDSSLNSASITSIHLSNNNKSNPITSNSESTSQHIDDTTMSTEAYPGMSSDDE